MSDAYLCDGCDEYRDGEAPFLMTTDPDPTTASGRTLEACSEMCAEIVIKEHATSDMLRYFAGAVRWNQHLETDEGDDA